mmetsp:Transcript_7142/g.18585  ORF Transcript_7142/g.18585 Transcript_7142/m.18585 type:complete len:231 (-) Transcript_7142:48-740(-)
MKMKVMAEWVDANLSVQMTEENASRVDVPFQPEPLNLHSFVAKLDRAVRQNRARRCCAAGEATGACAQTPCATCSQVVLQFRALVEKSQFGKPSAQQYFTLQPFSVKFGWLRHYLDSDPSATFSQGMADIPLVGLPFPSWPALNFVKGHASHVDKAETRASLVARIAKKRRRRRARRSSRQGVRGASPSRPVRREQPSQPALGGAPACGGRRACSRASLRARPRNGGAAR